MKSVVPGSRLPGPRWTASLQTVVVVLTLFGGRPAHAQAPGPREITFAELLAFAEQHAPSVRRARAQLAAGVAARAEASAPLHDDPTLSVGVGPRFAGAGQSSVDVEIGLSQPIEVAGERGLRRALAARLSERLEAEVTSTRAELRRELSLAFQGATLLRQRVALAAELRAFADKTLATSERRLAAGDATRIEVNVATADAAQAREAELLAQEELAAARIELSVISGWPLDTPPLVPSELGPVRPPPSLRAVLRRARARHPELSARAAATRQAQAEVELADRQAWPKPTLGVHFAREGSLGSPANTIVLGSVELPLPAWSSNQGARARARAEEGIAREEESLAAQARLAQLVNAHAALSSAATRGTLLARGAAEPLQNSLALYARGFEHGEFSALELSAAREKFARAALAALDARAAYLRARAELEYVLDVDLDAAFPAREGAAFPPPTSAPPPPAADEGGAP
jgi:outer membrane protein, heavy metal efflux system